jgi:hypothetical protein
MDSAKYLGLDVSPTNGPHHGNEFRRRSGDGIHNQNQGDHHSAVCPRATRMFNEFHAAIISETD